MASTFPELVVDVDTKCNGPDGESPPRSSTPEGLMSSTKLVSKGADSGKDGGCCSTWLKNVVLEAEFEKWLGRQIESSAIDPRDSPSFRYISFDSMPLESLNNLGSLTRKNLTPELFTRLKDMRTSSGFSISNAIQAGLLNPRHEIGFVCGDEESFEAFADILTPIIEDYHDFDLIDYEFESNLDADDLDLDEEQARSLHSSTSLHLLHHSLAGDGQEAQLRPPRR